MSPIIDSIEALEALYGVPNDASTVKEVPVITPEYRAMIDASPFAALATCGPEGLDCSPRGDRLGELVRVADERTLLMPDRRGNNRVDSLRNIVRDPRVALMFLIPGHGNALRVNGRAQVSVDPALLESFMVEGKAPRSVIVVTVETVYFQCARAVIRARLWESDARVEPGRLPTAGRILAALSEGKVGGEPYDSGWAERAKETMW
ncbi:pyridoxamine 5'-phosphate oxidase family protein [Roseomonas sp. SSH11]|uniref:Pyridoxamine 5'-phosphate oxidase family protein n=1 Tax=Pararoseomonas baculiformis TaxID=2820812 RepID=A0ABS4AJ44_9PROT|nr:pyridoxamine 5'-phosphate oxidase family protein [Pararoseomonas baculiformis]MBP0447042.1 pyridoxamine 5'-phosphate oxidase family protein [Pararoseomonas baculiformis]